MPYTSLLAVLKPKDPLTSHKSCRNQPIGMTLLVPSQYIQKATLVLAPAEVFTGKPVTLTVPLPPKKAPFSQVPGLPARAGRVLTGAGSGLPLAVPLNGPPAWPAESFTSPAVPFQLPSSMRYWPSKVAAKPFAAGSMQKSRSHAANHPRIPVNEKRTGSKEKRGRDFLIVGGSGKPWLFTASLPS